MNRLIRYHFACLAILLTILGSCTHSPQPERANVPADLLIQVEVNGRELPPISASTLAAPPDVRDEHRTAWKLDRFVGEISAARKLVVEQADGQRVVIPLGNTDSAAPNIALILNRKGEVLVAALDPEDPFPAFHGRGGNRGRGMGEQWVRQPSWLRLRSRTSEHPSD